MSAKEKILELLTSNKGSYISGEELASSIGISRAGVWKNIKALQNEGYLIDAVTNKGYCLSSNNDVFDEKKIRSYLTLPMENIDIVVLKETSSTNSLAYQYALQGYNEGLVILSRQQSLGRGHKGHTFYSPYGSGIYLSLLLRPLDLTQQDTGFITCMSAAAMCRALREVSGKDVGIKWANDLFLNDKKICGILTEGALDLESGLLNFCITGCGVNLYPPKDGFPKDISDIAGALFDDYQSDAGSMIPAFYINYFFEYYEEFKKGNHEGFLNDYRKYSLIIGKDILLEMNNKKYKAHITSIDDSCRLVIDYEGNKDFRLEPGKGSIKEIY
ncbi:MAG: biotin--[acetyl-CoA-carboxylase] ligase [Butyrivibrio sp.]|uniref:biotin--[acetyl-CoA-carboxylase] ligase n=1 Tax=Butyrivibrio sp. TaxID=28121 RepID=UPI0025F3453F|nr:biotin--[acetyl-CoA-carboxylase] ligase [Butyrivibrio sp.]MCR5771454.1 biotin--[acetyl-CoA-carboxylase] ligase [Butyrivibrio sp.]